MAATCSESATRLSDEKSSTGNVNFPGRLLATEYVASFIETSYFADNIMYSFGQPGNE